MIKAFLKNSFIYTIGTVLTKGISILLVPVYTRYLSPLEYGIIDLFIIVAAIINLMIALELHQAVVRFYQDVNSNEERMEYVSTAFLFTVFVYSLYLLLSFLFSDIFTVWLLHDISYKNTFLLASGAIFTRGLLYFTHGQLKWQILPRKFTIVSVVNVTLVAIISIYLLVIEDMKIESIFIGQIIGNIIGIILSIYYANTSYRFIFILRKFKEMASFSLPLVFSGMAIFIAMFIDRIAIKYFLGLEELGVYGIAYRFAAITSLLMMGFQSSLSPLIYKHYRENETPKNIIKLFNLFVLLALLIMMGATLFSKEMIVLMSTKEYYSAAPLIPILVASVFFTNMYIFVPGLALAKKTKMIAAISIFGAVLNSVLNFIFVPKIGVEGAAYSTLVSAIIIFMIYVHMSQKYYNLPFEWEKILMSAVISVVGASILAIQFYDINLFNILIKVFFMTMFALVVVLLLDFNLVKLYFKKRMKL